MKQQIFNPYLPPYEYIPDGEPRVFGDRLYIFGSHDKFGGKWYCENDYVTWSAPLSDLSDWRYEGVIYTKEQDSRQGNLYAPDVVQGPDGNYYLYYSKDDTSVISVAVCDTPSGKYEYYGDIAYENGKLLGGDENEYFMFDPSVLIDNGRIWLYSGSSKRGTTTKIKRNMAGCTVTELCADMKTVKAAPKVVLKDAKNLLSNGYFEAPSVRKIDNLYYLVYSARNGSGLHYATSHYADRAYTYRGCIHSPSDIGYQGKRIISPSYPLGNTHGGLVNLNGEWYIFNHRMTNRSSFSRQGVAEKISIKADGSIAQVEATSQGLNGKPLIAEGNYPAYIACNLMSQKSIPLKRKTPYITQSGTDGDKSAESFVSGVRNDALVGYKYFYFSGGEYQIFITVRGSSGSLSMRLANNGKCIGSASLTQSPSWQKAIINCYIPHGKQEIIFCYHGKGNIDILDFEIKKLYKSEGLKNEF